MLKEIRPAILILVLLTLITGLAYPLALIGQDFKDYNFFQGRPSATTAPDPADSTKTVPAPYNAANSGGSNLGPTRQALNYRGQVDDGKLKQENASAPVPIDLVTTSGSG